MNLTTLRSYALFLSLAFCMIGSAQQVSSYTLFSPSTSRAVTQEIEQVERGTILAIDLDALHDLRAEMPSQLSLEVPIEDREMFHVDLHQVDIFSPDFILQSSSGEDLSSVDLGIHYRGSIEGAEHSVVAISVFEEEIKGILVADHENYNLGPLRPGNTEYICYRSVDLSDEVRSRFNFSCDMVETETGVYSLSQLEFAQRDPGEPTSVYIEMDKALFDAQGGDPGLSVSYAAALFNESAAIFDAESILLDLSEIFIWTSPDPYDGVNVGPGVTRSYLQDFQDAIDGFNGDLGVLLIEPDIGGVAAGFDGICNPDQDLSLCVAGRSGPDLEPFPTYSYNVYNFTHELGHLFGSRHTHACVWNGDDTAIDGCSGFTEGGCTLPPNPASGEATIMSYCQDELAGGFVAAAPFGLQPGAVIRSTVASATCLGCPEEDFMYLPDVLGSGPALMLCAEEPVPPGYSFALSQFCAISIIESEPDCGVISWDASCQALYDACLVPGCMDPLACNYDPLSNIEDSMCVYGPWYIPVDYTLSTSEPAVQACAPPSGYELADQSCIEDLLGVDPACAEIDWDGICNDAYLICAGVDCSVFDTAPVDLTKSFDPVGGVQDRVQVKWFKEIPQVRYSDADAAACDIKFWPKRDLIPGTTTPTGPVIVAAPSDTINIIDAKKFLPDGTSPREIFKWPVKFRADGANNTKRAEPNIRYEWKVRCACEHGIGQESPWSAVKIFNTPDFDPTTGIYTPPPGSEFYSPDAKSLKGPMDIQVYPNPSDGSRLALVFNDPSSERFRLRLCDMTGREILIENFVLGKDLRYEMLMEGQSLQSGTYSVQILTSSGILQKLIIVER